jgi:hypothetical protein
MRHDDDDGPGGRMPTLHELAERLRYLQERSAHLGEVTGTILDDLRGRHDTPPSVASDPEPARPPTIVRLGKSADAIDRHLDTLDHRIRELDELLTGGYAEKSLADSPRPH